MLPQRHRRGKSENAHIADTAHPHAVGLRQRGLYAVFKHLQTVFVRQVHEGFHIGRIAECMHRHHGFCFFGQVAFYVVRVQV